MFSVRPRLRKHKRTVQKIISSKNNSAARERVNLKYTPSVRQTKNRNGAENICCETSYGYHVSTLSIR